MALNFGDRPMQLQCPHCHNDVSTVTESGDLTTTGCVASLVLCLLFCPLAFIPCCMDECKSVTHTCPKCKRNLGEYKR